jgi:hypothetical protein
MPSKKDKNPKDAAKAIVDNKSKKGSASAKMQIAATPKGA